MPEISEKTKYLLFGYGPKMHASMAIVAEILAIICFFLGIISSALKTPLGLEGNTWLLLTIIFFIWNLLFWLSAYFGAKEGYTGR